MDQNKELNLAPFNGGKNKTYEKEKEVEFNPTGSGDIFRDFGFSEQAEQDFAVIFEGDFGGQIYLTCPALEIKCNENPLHQLLLDIRIVVYH